MKSWAHAVLLLAVIGTSAAQFRSSFPGGRKASEDFDCPEDFGYYPHPVDCSKYYVCVFGGALEEVCTNGLVYSDDLLTCDWPRNVEACAAGVDSPRTPSGATAAASSAAPSRARQPTSRGRPSARTSPRRPTPVRNNLDVQRGSDRDLAEQARLLGGIESQPRDLNVRFEGDTNKIVARRQQRLFSPDSSSGRGRFQQSLQAAPPVNGTARPPDITDADADNADGADSADAATDGAAEVTDEADASTDGAADVADGADASDETGGAAADSADSDFDREPPSDVLLHRLGEVGNSSHPAVDPVMTAESAGRLLLQLPPPPQLAAASSRRGARRLPRPFVPVPLRGGADPFAVLKQHRQRSVPHKSFSANVFNRPGSGRPDGRFSAPFTPSHLTNNQEEYLDRDYYGPQSYYDRPRSRPYYRTNDGPYRNPYSTTYNSQYNRPYGVYEDDFRTQIFNSKTKEVVRSPPAGSPYESEEQFRPSAQSPPYKTYQQTPYKYDKGQYQDKPYEYEKGQYRDPEYNKYEEQQYNDSPYKYEKGQYQDPPYKYEKDQYRDSPYKYDDKEEYKRPTYEPFEEEPVEEGYVAPVTYRPHAQYSDEYTDRYPTAYPAAEPPKVTTYRPTAVSSTSAGRDSARDQDRERDLGRGQDRDLDREPPTIASPFAPAELDSWFPPFATPSLAPVRNQSRPSNSREPSYQTEPSYDRDQGTYFDSRPSLPLAPYSRPRRPDYYDPYDYDDYYRPAPRPGPTSTGGLGRDNSQLRAKATAAPPIRISTLSSFSFGDTGTRFPEREPSRPSATFAPPAPSAPSTFVSSNRSPLPPSPSPSPFPPSTVTVQTVSTGRPPVPAPTPASPDVQSYTEPAYVAYVNDTIYDVYYIYDDEEVLYEDEVPNAPARQPARPPARPTTTTTEATTARTEFPQRTTLSPPRLTRLRTRKRQRTKTRKPTKTTPKTTDETKPVTKPTKPPRRRRIRTRKPRTTTAAPATEQPDPDPSVWSPTRPTSASFYSFGTGVRPTSRGRGGSSRTTQPSRSRTTTTTRRGNPTRSSFSPTDSFRKTPTTDLSSTRGSTFGSTFSSPSRGSTFQSNFGPSSTRAAAPSESSFGSTRTAPSSESTFGSTRTSTRGSTRGSTSDSTRTSTLGSTRGTSTLDSTRGSSPTRGSLVEAPATPSRGSARGKSRGSARGSARGSKTSSGSRRRPTNGLRSIDSGSGRRPQNGVTFPKRPKNSGRGQSSRPKVNIWEHPASRPDPVYATPIPDDPAERCDARCKLPDCNCGGTATPGGIKTENVPQLVLLTFDDSVNDLNKGLYKDMFENNRVNPNGCPIAATFYVSHEWTDYKQVQNLYADGHEIASHSISHSFGEQFSTSKWEREIAGQREILAAYGGVRMDDIRGMRAPFLSIGGNRMFKMLYNNNFTYDSSMPVYENNPPSWPYTLDYKIHHDCMIPPCPSRSFPGVWEVPMVMWQDLNGGRCSMVDACSPPKTAEDVYKMLIKNFERHYSSNRAVFPLYFHAAWFTTEHHKEGFMAFLDTISNMDDVWLVTNWQAIQWMRDPQPLSTVNSFQPFGCDYPERPPRCTKAKKCNLWHKSGIRYMTTCQPCPEKYPWTGKTGVSRP